MKENANASHKKKRKKRISISDDDDVMNNLISYRIISLSQHKKQQIKNIVISQFSLSCLYAMCARPFQRLSTLIFFPSALLSTLCEFFSFLSASASRQSESKQPKQSSSRAPLKEFNGNESEEKRNTIFSRERARIKFRR